MLLKLRLGGTPEGGSGWLYVRSSAIVALRPDPGSTSGNQRLKLHLISGAEFSIAATAENEQDVKKALSETEREWSR